MQQFRADIVRNLRTQIQRLEGFRSRGGLPDPARLSSFPWSSFPFGAVHEFLCARREDVAPTSGFIAGLLAHVTGRRVVTLWISAGRRLFPSALKAFGLDPECFLFIDVARETEVLWAMEESLKCPAVSAVVGEIGNIDFTASRRLQLAVEQSHATGFVVRNTSRMIGTTAFVSRWRITTLPSNVDDNLPGVGFPVWKVELLRMRNGRPGSWIVRWENEAFVGDQSRASEASVNAERKAI